MIDESWPDSTKSSPPLVDPGPHHRRATAEDNDTRQGRENRNRNHHSNHKPRQSGGPEPGHQGTHWVNLSPSSLSELELNGLEESLSAP